MTDPYYSDDQVELYLGDCRDVVPALGLAADLVLTDPPYGETTYKWDQWVPEWPSLAASIATSMWSFGSMRVFTEHWTEFRDWTFSQDVVWEKHNGSSGKRDRFNRVHENAVFFYRGRWAETYHVPPTTADAVKRTVHQGSKAVHHQGRWGAGSYTSERGGPRIMRSVIFMRSMHGRGIHGTEKPTGLLEPLLTYACPLGGLVVDLFGGSGSTLEACKRTGRRGIAIEGDEAIAERAARRLAQGLLT